MSAVGGEAVEPVIEVRGLRKRYGRTTALAGLDLRVGPGEVMGFLGPNGSGKSTALRSLLGLIRAEADVARVFGLDPWRDAARIHRRLAYVPSDVRLWPGLTGREVLDLMARLRGSAYGPRQEALAERFGLDPDRPTRTYSRGNRQKVLLVAALAAQVELLLLDEPTTGLDPLVAAEFGACVQEHAAAGGSVLLSSHVLGEVEQVCDRVTIIRDGRAVLSGTLEELRHVRHTALRVELERPLSGGLGPAQDVVVAGREVTCTVAPGDMAAVMQVLASHGVVSLEARPPSLEQIFLREYGADGS